MIQELEKETIIGMDVEAHNYRTYLGITCLIQISSATKDYLVDPFPLWAEMPILNEVTANPRIVKVLHGCDGDIVWLQRDFSLYLRNVFDTHQAGKLLNLPRLSLAYLLQNYCSLDVDKQFQLADWRIRPLPSEMVFYARQDTRYLIYLYTRLKNELISRGNAESNLLHAALHQSNDICKRRFYKPSLHPDSHLDMVRKARATLNNKQLFCLKELFHWRDKLARTEDESVMYVLPNHMMMKIATELPREMQGIIACCNPVPPLVRQHLVTLHNIVLQARDKQLMTVDPALVPATDNTEHHVTNFSTVNNLDLRHLEDAGDLETVLQKKVSFANNNLSKVKPDLSVFAKQKPIKSKPSRHEFVSPHQRYVLMRPYLESLEKVNDSKEEDSNKPTNDNIRLDSIRQHFEKLTEMTPKPVEKKENEEEDAVESGEVTSEEEEVEPKAKKPYFEANNDERDKVKHLRAGVKEKGGKNKNGKNKNFNKGKRSFDGTNSNFDNSRRKSAPGGPQNAGGPAQERNGNNEQGKNKNFNNKGKRPFEGAPQSGKKPRRKSESESNQQQKKELMNKEGEVAKNNVEKKEQKDFDYNKVNFKNFGTKKAQDQDYDPNKAEKENSKKGGKKKNQFHKRGNKSATFKRS